MKAAQSTKELQTTISEARAAVEATLGTARSFISDRRGKIDALYAERDALENERNAIWKRPLPWPERVNEIVDDAVEDLASKYQEALATWARNFNPGFSGNGRWGYKALPFLTFNSAFSSDPPPLGTGYVSMAGTKADEVSATSLAFFLPEIFTAKLKTLLLGMSDPAEGEQHMPRDERDAELARIKTRLDAIEVEVAGLKSELDEVASALQ